jgi:hypothetical protein
MSLFKIFTDARADPPTHWLVLIVGTVHRADRTLSD